MDQIYWDIIEQVIVIAIGVVLPPVLALVAVYLKQITNALVARIEGEIGASNFEMLKSMAIEAVHAAEQSGLNDMIANVGEEKKRFALKYVQDLLDARGVDISLNEIDVAVEAAVNKTFNKE